ncbi:hypothetical protein Fmac_018146 [Flemingia macrophylla]|uniref:Uncharacterized protein n=1 Tax=Flemingia macrophylla TaxID=520843 RepID=A0ABD1M455_9FABA
MKVYFGKHIIYYNNLFNKITTTKPSNYISSQTFTNSEAKHYPPTRTKFKSHIPIKKQVDDAEATKAKSLSELESAKEILQNLTTKLANVSQCKQSTMAATEVVRNKSRQFEKTVSLKAVGYESK